MAGSNRLPLAPIVYGHLARGTISSDEKPVEVTTLDISPACRTEPSSEAGKEHKSKRLRHAHHFRPARPLVLAWISAMLTLVFLIMTAVYAVQATVASRIRFVYASSSNTMFVLSVLSGMTGLFLAATIAAAFERLQWLLVARKEGLQLTKFLGLQTGTGLNGLFVLMAGGGHPILTTTRLWAAVRLGSIILVPILGMVIMSNVNTQMTFDVIDEPRLSSGWGMSPFNASLAKNISVISDQILIAEMFSFLSHPARTINITPGPLRSIQCSRGPESQGGQICERTFFIPGGAELAGVTVYDDFKSTQSDVFLAQHQQGYLLHFQESDDWWRAGEAASCQAYGFAFAAFQLCLRNRAENVLDARIVHCPSDFSSQAVCRSNTSWHSNPGWATTLTALFRHATVAYSKSNGSIISHTFSDMPMTPAPVSASELVQGYIDSLGNFTHLQDFLGLFQDPDKPRLFPLYTYPAFMWGTYKAVSDIGYQNPAATDRAATVLQVLLAGMLYYCQPSLFARSLSKLAGKGIENNDDDDVTKFAADLLAIAPPDTHVSLAGLRYQIVVGQATLIAYVVLCGVALILCLGVFLLGSYMPLAGKVPGTSPFPTWDFGVHCRVECVCGVGHHEHIDLHRQLKGDELVQAAANLTVKLLDTEKSSRSTS